MEMKYGTHITFSDLLFIISRTKECQYHTVCSKRRFYNIRNVTFILGIIKVAHILAGYILMLG